MSLNSQKAELSHPYPSGFMSRHILWVLLAILLLVSRAAAQTASPSTLPPEGSDESKIAIGDVPAKVVALLGEPLSYSDISPTRSRCVFKRCTIVFESRKVAELPVMKTIEDLARESAERKRAAIASLTSRFVVEPAGIGSSLYIHKSFPRGQYGTMPAVVVDDKGSMGLVTNYFGGRWIFHDSANVAISGKVMPTSLLAPSVPVRRVSSQGSFIEEKCVFSAPNDQDIIRAIAKASGGVTISLLKGHASVASQLTEQQFSVFSPIYPFSASDLSAVRDCVALADALASGDDSKSGSDTNTKGK
jgi:hypothetical protein